MTTTKKRRVTVFFDPYVIRLAKVQAIVEKLSLTAFVEKILLIYLPQKIIIKKIKKKKGD